jgi:hypothetical protein
VPREAAHFELTFAKISSKVFLGAFSLCMSSVPCAEFLFSFLCIVIVVVAAVHLLHTAQQPAYDF